MSELDNVLVKPSETKKEPAHITSVDQISNLIKRKDVTYAAHCYIPSLKIEVPFAEINTSQQKRLVKSVIDSQVYNTEFIYTLREILKENCQDSSINIDNLTIIDKLTLALALRVKSIGPTVEIEIQTKQGPKMTVNLDVPTILKTAITTLQDIVPVVIEDDYYKIECSLPTIGVEYKAEKELRDPAASIEITTPAELRKTVGEAFVSEIAKYVSAVYVKGEEAESLIPVDWHKFSCTDRIKVIETFKTSLLRSVMDFINSVRKEIDKIELVKFEFGGEVYDRRLSIDGSFFTIS